MSKIAEISWGEFLRSSPPGRFFRIPDLNVRRPVSAPELNGGNVNAGAGAYAKAGNYSGSSSDRDPSYFCSELPTVKLYCEEKTCEGELFHEAAELDDYLSWTPDGAERGDMLEYRCNNCGRGRSLFGIVTKLDPERNLLALKMGQYPALGGAVPASVKALTHEHYKELLIKGIACLRLGYGVAAHAYLRQVLEGIHVDLLKQVRSISPPADQAKYDEAITKGNFSDSLELVSHVIPDALKIGTENPLRLIYSAFSEELHHGDDDDDCFRAAQHGLSLLILTLDAIAAQKRLVKFQKSAIEELAQIHAESKSGRTSPSTSSEAPQDESEQGTF